MDIVSIVEIFNELSNVATTRFGGSLKSWLLDWQHPDRGVLRRRLARAVARTQNLAGAGAPETALLIAHVGRETLGKATELSNQERAGYFAGLRWATSQIVATLPRFRAVPERRQTRALALNELQNAPQANRIFEIAWKYDVDDLLPIYQGARPLDRKKSIHIASSILGGRPQAVLTSPDILMIEGAANATRLLKMFEHIDASNVVVLFSGVDSGVLESFEQSYPGSCYAVVGDGFHQLGVDLGVRPTGKPLDFAATCKAQAVAFHPREANVVLQDSPKHRFDYRTALVTPFTQSDPEWVDLDKTYRTTQKNLHSGVIGHGGLTDAAELVENRLISRGAGYNAGAVMAFDASRHLDRTFLGEKLSLPALSAVIENATDAVTSTLGTELGVSLPVVGPAILVGAAGHSFNAVARGISRSGARSGRSRGSPLVSGPATRATSESTRSPGVGDGGARGDDLGGGGGNGGGDGSASSGDHPGETNRRLDVLLTGDVTPGAKVTLTATVRLLQSETIGQWTDVFLLSSPEDPVEFRVEAEGFEVDGQRKIEQVLPEDRDASPVAFILIVKESKDHWITLSLWQDNQPLAELTISSFALQQIEREQALRRAAQVDLTLNIEPDGSIVAFSPRSCKNLADQPMGRLVEPETRLIDGLRKQIEVLYKSDDLEGVEYQLKILGTELAQCLPQGLRELLASDQIETLLIRHSVSSTFPYELVYLDDREPGRFLTDRVSVSHWLRGFTSVGEPRTISRAAFIRGKVSTATEEEDLLAEICEEIQPFGDPKAVLNEVFRVSEFDLLHFIGHCKGQNGEAVLELAEGDLPARQIGALREERKFGQSAPIVVINGCSTANPSLALFGDDSIPHRFIRAGASAVLGTHFSVEARIAHEFSRAFYTRLAAGFSLDKAVLGARGELSTHPHGSEKRQVWQRISLRSYCLFAHPGMTVVFAKQQEAA